MRLVQRVRKPILDAAGALLPVGGVVDPVGAMGDVGPGADMGDPRHQACRYRRRSGRAGRSARAIQAVGRRSPGPARCRKHCARKRAWLSLIILRKSGIWQTSHKQPHRRRVGRQRRRPRRGATRCAAPDGRRPRGPGRGPARAAARRGCCSSAPTESKLEPRCCARRCGSAARSDASSTALDDLRVERAFVGGRAEGAVAHVAAGAAGDLADLGRPTGGAVPRPSNLASRAKATWSRSMLRPMPIASVATR